MWPPLFYLWDYSYVSFLTPLSFSSVNIRDYVLLTSRWRMAWLSNSRTMISLPELFGFLLKYLALLHSCTTFWCRLKTVILLLGEAIENKIIFNVESKEVKHELWQCTDYLRMFTTTTVAKQINDGWKFHLQLFLLQQLLRSEINGLFWLVLSQRV